MAVKAESFLVLEKSLSIRVGNAWDRAVSPVLAKIVKAVREKNFNLATDLVYQIDMRPVVEKQKKFIILVGMGAALYGAAKTTTPRDSTLFRKTVPPEVRQAADVLVEMLAEEGTKQARMEAQKLIAAAELSSTAGALKADAAPFITGFPKLVKRAGRTMVDVGAGLHTSRLANWGYAVEADARGKEFYKISEQLDGRTCPVCRVMHGKVFPVRSALNKLETHLAVSDPNDLKAIAEWPKQNPAAVAALSTMTTEQLIARGWDTPPFHPACRGIMVNTSKTIAPDAFDRNQQTPSDAAFVASILKPSSTTPGAAVVVSTSDTGEPKQ